MAIQTDGAIKDSPGTQVHTHASTAQGGNIPQSSVTDLVADLATKAPASAEYLVAAASASLSAEKILGFDATHFEVLSSVNALDVSFSTGLGFLSVLGQMLQEMDGAAADIDAHVVYGEWHGFIYGRQAFDNAWGTPTNATYTVPTGKKAVIVATGGSSSLYAGDGNYKARVYNTTDTADVVADTTFALRPFQFIADDSARFVTVAAGKVFKQQVFNGNGYGVNVFPIGWCIFRVVNV